MEDQKRAAYEAALHSVVDAVHGIVTAFEALAIASRAWDPENVKNSDDAAAHATIASCSAMMRSILNRYPAAAQMFGLEQLFVQVVARTTTTAGTPSPETLGSPSEGN